jgi:GR25 family glycosyltransferase involved in LPS biosynthesis
VYKNKNNINYKMSEKLHDYTVDELRKKCKSKGIKGYSKLKKVELIQLLKNSHNKTPSFYKSSGEKGNPINKFFTKIFIINLAGKNARFKKVTKKLAAKGIKYERFEAVDGRCPDPKDCNKKKKELEEKYNVKISKKLNSPAASLTIGTIVLLREMVKRKWKRILICEDDIEPTRNVNEIFKKGIKELEEEEPNWDLLYLGCGNNCGVRGISNEKTSKNRNKTSMSIVNEEWDWYVQYKNDLRTPCDKEDCEIISKHLTIPYSPGGTWCYAYSLKGAKKILKYFNNKITDHIDQLLIKAVHNDIVKVVAFDPTIVQHEFGAIRVDTSIPWDW